MASLYIYYIVYLPTFLDMLVLDICFTDDLDLSDLGRGECGPDTVPVCERVTWVSSTNSSPSLEAPAPIESVWVLISANTQTVMYINSTSIA